MKESYYAESSNNAGYAQRKVVLVTGIGSRLPMDEIVATLRSYFGRYGNIAGIRRLMGVASHSRPAPMIGLHITYSRHEHAARAVLAMHGIPSPGNGQEVLSVRLATYCASISRNQPCVISGCLDLHERGDQEEGHNLRQDPISRDYATNAQLFQRDGGHSAGSRSFSDPRAESHNSLDPTLSRDRRAERSYSLDPTMSRDSSNTPRAPYGIGSPHIGPLTGANDTRATNTYWSNSAEQNGSMTTAHASSSRLPPLSQTAANGQRTTDWNTSPSAMTPLSVPGPRFNTQSSSSFVPPTDNFTSLDGLSSARSAVPNSRLTSQPHLTAPITRVDMRAGVRAPDMNTFSRTTPIIPIISSTASNLFHSANSTGRDSSGQSSSQISNLSELLSSTRISNEGLDEIRDLSNQVRRRSYDPEGLGGFANVFIGDWYRSPGVIVVVAIKVLRPKFLDPRADEKARKHLRDELKVWQSLRHRHVLELYGVCSGFGRYAALVSPWLNNGSISMYLRNRHPVAGASVRLKLLYESAEGLQYLHSISPAVIHGDLTTSNILVKNDGEACICDFGLSKIIEEATGMPIISTTNLSGNLRWMAPELFIKSERGGFSWVSVKTDVYSFGCVAYEVLTGRIPFYDLKNDPQVIAEVVKGARLRNPTEGMKASDEEWRYIKKCCADEPAARPVISEVFQNFKRLWEASVSQGVQRSH